MRTSSPSWTVLYVVLVSNAMLLAVGIAGGGEGGDGGDADRACVVVGGNRGQRCVGGPFVSTRTVALTLPLTLTLAVALTLPLTLTLTVALTLRLTLTFTVAPTLTLTLNPLPLTLT